MLSPLQLKGVEAILSEKTYRKAARKVGVNECSIYEWLRLPEFREQLHTALSAGLEEATAVLAWNSADAARALVKELNAKQPNRERIKAASVILSQCLKYVDTVYLQTEILKIEEQLKAMRQ